MAQVEVFPDQTELIRTEADRLVTLASAAVEARGRCLISLAGGSTPRPLYELLATAPRAAAPGPPPPGPPPRGRASSRSIC